MGLYKGIIYKNKYITPKTLKRFWKTYLSKQYRYACILSIPVLFIQNEEGVKVFYDPLNKRGGVTRKQLYKIFYCPECGSHAIFLDVSSMLFSV